MLRLFIYLFIYLFIVLNDRNVGMIILWYDKKFTWDHHSLGENDFLVPESAYVGLCPRGPLAREQHSPRGSCAFARKQDHKGDGYLLDTLLTIYWLNLYLSYNTWDLVFPWYPPGLMLHTSLASAPMFCLSYIVENWLVFYQLVHVFGKSRPNSML